MNQKFSQYIGIFIKILFLAIGLADFFGVLPPSLDILDKLITSLILAYFWYELKFSSFLFGKRKQWLDWSILATYYILVSESVIGLFFDASHISLLSSITVSVGFGSLILISAYVANKLTFSKKSVMHSFARLFIRKEEQWNNFADTQGSSKIVKFFLSLIVLFAIFQYFFSLVNQWFVISLDKTLLVLAILFAVKDIKGTKSKVLNKIGDFDDWLLKTITELFTNHKKFYLGFSVLLIFHYLSDLATFFIPYFIPSITIDPFYMNFLGDPTGSSHLAISTLLSQEAVSSGASAFLGTVAYWFSGFGILVLLLFPVIFLYFILNDKDISSFFEKRRQSLLWYLLFLFAFIFEIAPWVRQQKIIANGIQGVDFLTQHISQVANIEIIGLLSLTLLLISLFLLNKKKLAKYAFTAVFLMSFSYLGQYIWNFYSSSVHYHVLVISSQNMFIGVLFSLSLLLETLFYLGGFFLLTYHASRIVIKEVVKELLTDTSAFVWTIIFILLPLSLLFAGTAKAFTLATIVIVTILIFSYAMHQLLIGNELRDDYLLGIIATIASYQFILIFEFILEETTRLTIATITFLEPFILLLIGYSLLKYFKLSFTLKKIPLLQIIKIAMIAFVFSLFFWLIAEPRPAIGNSLLVNGIYLFLVSAGEELLFRRLLFGLATKNFSRQKSNHLQALMFSLIHFVGIASIITYYQGGASHLFSSVTLNIGAWAVGLYLFGLIAARLVDASEKPSMSRTILFHFLVNFFVLIIF